MSVIQVRINGRGNAWPVILGQEHPYYNRHNLEDLANASCSILKSKAAKPEEDQVDWDLMIDAGHGAVQYLLKNFNRIPEAVFITHPHIDHTLGLDWIVQSHYKKHQAKYPVYTTILCWKVIINTFPQLEPLVEFKELIPFQKTEVSEVDKVTITAYPVFHGNSANGAAMLLFQIQEENQVLKILFTGDILCPLLRNDDYTDLKNIDLMVTDANNRFPYPKSNHWSILAGTDQQQSNYLKEFIHESSIGTFISPHLKDNISKSYCRCFDYFLNKECHPEAFHFTVESFMKAINPKKVAFIHYSGSEDQKYYNEKILKDSELINWINQSIRLFNSNTRFFVPYVSQHIELLSIYKTD